MRSQLEIIKFDPNNPAALKTVKRNTIARLHGRRLVSASMLKDLLRLTKDDPSREIIQGAHSLVIRTAGPGYQITNSLKYLEIAERRTDTRQASGLYSLNGLNLSGPDRPGPFVKNANTYGRAI